MYSELTENTIASFNCINDDLKRIKVTPNGVYSLKDKAYNPKDMTDYKYHGMPNRNSLTFDNCGKKLEEEISYDGFLDKYSKKIELLNEKLLELENDIGFYEESSTVSAKVKKSINRTSNVEKKKKKPNRPVSKTSYKITNIKSEPIGSKLSKNKLQKTNKTSSNKELTETKLPKSNETKSIIYPEKFKKACTQINLKTDDKTENDPNKLFIEKKEKVKMKAKSEIIKPKEDYSVIFPRQHWPMRESLFLNVPPYIYFKTHSEVAPIKIPYAKKIFTWKLSPITPVILKKVLNNTGFHLIWKEFSRNSDNWIGTWGKHIQTALYRSIKDNQKINHFPGIYHLGCKDKLWRCFQKCSQRFGSREFGFLPLTFVLPQDARLLKAAFHSKASRFWIIKPPALARGIGIQVINRYSQIPKNIPIVVQRYISNPYLINGRKFDLRLYVLITSFNPLRIYLYPEGLVRFASEVYMNDDVYVHNKYMHLTNYSINKLSDDYEPNEDATTCSGHKWTLSKLMEYLQKNQVDTSNLWKKLKKLVIKTFIACEDPIVQTCEEFLNTRYNCYELFGVDVLLDDKLKPWLLEVNISPSLHSNTPLDVHVKGPLCQTVLNMVQFHFPRKLSFLCDKAPKGFEPKLYTNILTRPEWSKHERFESTTSREEYITAILKDLSPDDVRYLIQAEDELVVKENFERIFPTHCTFKYLKFLETRYYNLLFDAWESRFYANRQAGVKVLQNFCSKNFHLRPFVLSSVNKTFNGSY